MDNYNKELIMLRKCKGCGLEAHTEDQLSLFASRKSCNHGRRPMCKPCVNKTQVSGDRQRNNSLRSLYGITLDDYNRMFAEQRGCCAICGIHQTETKKRLYVDHCHNSSKVRQLLCQHCNSLLGFAKDDANILAEALNYINKHKEY